MANRFFRSLIHGQIRILRSDFDKSFPDTLYFIPHMTVILCVCVCIYIYRIKSFL